ncbi:MAG: Gfo/Idh/MocA family oxidoreductase [Candidatus Latescibacterota bacterium]
MPLHIGVIGAGVHGRHHIRLLSAMSEIRFAGIYDTDPGICASTAAEFGTGSFHSLEELLRKVDCVTVAVPTSYHRDVVLECFSRGKSVLVEKPIAVTVAEANEMVAEADKRGLILAVGHLERFNPAYRALKGEPVRPVFIESHRLAVFNPRGTDVAVVLDLMIHDIDIVLDMVGKPVTAVHAAGVSVVTDEADIANARLQFEGGCVANLTASRISQKKMRKVRMFQRNAYVSMDFLTGETEIFALRPDTRPEGLAGAPPQLMGGISYRKVENDSANALELELRDFISAVEKGSRPRVNGQEGCRALEVASRVMESMETSMRNLE